MKKKLATQETWLSQRVGWLAWTNSHCQVVEPNVPWSHWSPCPKLLWNCWLARWINPSHLDPNLRLIGCLSHYLQGFSTIQTLVGLGISEPSTVVLDKHTNSCLFASSNNANSSPTLIRRKYDPSGNDRKSQKLVAALKPKMEIMKESWMDSQPFPNCPKSICSNRICKNLELHKSWYGARNSLRMTKKPVWDFITSQTWLGLRHITKNYSWRRPHLCW